MKTAYGILNFNEGNCLVAYEGKNPNSFGVTSFEKNGIGFFMENQEFAESFQIYKATDNRDIYFINWPLYDKRKSKWQKNQEICQSRKDLMNRIDKYFKGVKDFFTDGFDESTITELKLSVM